MKEFKPCKGINKAYGFDSCGNMVIAKTRKAGLCPKCYKKWWLLNTPEGNRRIQSAADKATRPRRELEKAQKEHSERKKLSYHINQTQIVFNRFIRLRDKGKPCISSLEPWRSDFDAGHLFSVKQYNSLRFDEDNCHAQSIGDNRFNEGNFEQYIINVRDRIGEERFNELEQKAIQSKRGIKKWTIPELKEIQKEYRKKYNQLKTQIS